jgi:hypothetical protein
MESSQLFRRFIIFSIFMLTLPLFTFFYIQRGGGSYLWRSMGWNSVHTSTFCALGVVHLIIFFFVFLAMREERNSNHHYQYPREKKNQQKKGE